MAKQKCMVIDYKKISPGDKKLIAKIAARAVAYFGRENIEPTLLEMDLTAAHIFSPLRLNDFLCADDGNFGHDIGGIQKNIDRRTGDFDNFFCPRFSA